MGVQHHDRDCRGIGKPAATLRPVVMWIGAPISFSEILWAAASACHAADSGDHFISEFHDPRSRSLLDDAQRAGHRARIAPDEKGAAFVRPSSRRIIVSNRTARR